jgi:hypothetical protein
MTNARDKANIPVLNFQSKGIDDNADATAITINSSEQVGIGTASPDHLLHISASSSNAQLKLQRTGSATASYNISASSDSLAFSDQVAGTERMRLTSTGLGIGTSSPTHDLTVDGGTSTSVSLIKDATGAATVRYYDGGSQKAYIQLTSSEDMDFFAASGVDQIFYGNGAEVMRLSSGAVFNEGSGDRDFRVESNNNTHMLFVDGGTDRVGIGTSSPGAKLEINSTGNYYNTANQHQQWSYNGTPFLSLYMDAYASPYFDTDSASAWNPGATMVFKRQGSEKMRITSDGKVGIGDSAPLAKLQVTTANSGVSPHPLADELFIENSGDVGITLGSSTSGTGSIMFGDSGDPNRGRIRYHQSTDKMEFGTAGGSEKMVIDSGGRLLVGTSSAPGDTDEVVIVGQATANGKAGMSVKAPTNHAAGNGSAIVAFDFLGNNYYSSSGKWGIYYRFLAENDAGSYADRGRMHFLPGYDGNSTTGGNGFLFRYNGNFTSDADNVADLGSSSNRWNDLYLGGGAYLGGTGSSNKLDDYEEGNWTPGVTFGGGNTGVSSGASTGSYTKIGRMVYASALLLLSNKGTSTGNAQITGLPFSMGAGNKMNGAVSFAYIERISFNEVLTGSVSSSNTTISLYEAVSGNVSPNTITNSDFNNSTALRFNVTYQTD